MVRLGILNGILRNFSRVKCEKKESTKIKFTGKQIAKPLLCTLFVLHECIQCSNDFIAIRVESEILRWTMSQTVGRKRERAKGVRMKLSLSFFGERLVEVCVCVHFQETNKRSICSPGYKVAGGVRRAAIDCCTTEESKFNVPPNLFDIIYKMTTFIWHHDNRKVAFGSHSIFSAICSPMPLLNSDIAIPHTIENEKFSLERDFRALSSYSRAFFAPLYIRMVESVVRLQLVLWTDSSTHTEKKFIISNMNCIWILLFCDW